MRALLATLVMVTVGGVCWAQVPAGGEFRVNSYTIGNQISAQVAMGADGSFVVVWTSNQQDGSGFGVFGQRFAADGVFSGAEFQVNIITFSTQSLSNVVSGPNGSFIATWSSAGGSGFDVYARRFGANGAPLGTEFLVNTQTTDTQYRSAIAALANGDFMVVWNSFVSALGAVDARWFDRQGAAAGPEFTVSGPGQSRSPDIAASSDRFVIVWRDFVSASAADVVGRLFDRSGSPIGSPFRANSSSNCCLFFPSVATAANGSFVVAWQNPEGDGSSHGVLARLFTSGGTPIGNEFVVNVTTVGPQAFPSVAADDLGNFIVTWTHLQGVNSELFARRFDSSGLPRGGEFRVNSYTTGHQVESGVDTDAVGNFVIAWQSEGQDGSEDGVFLQRFGGLVPAAASVDTVASPQSNGNRVLEAGESVDLRPSWRNLNGGPQTFGGALMGLTGPAGATYTITDGGASYGTVTHGDTGACADCYGVSVSAPPSRPALHWDATAVESITPDSHGQRKGWRLHVGGSFTDVPRPSPYYRFVETLLHNGVTGGCSGSIYCAQGSALREQMPVFVLVAKEGASYAPRPCATPMFPDVPAGSPFCPWIEELARREVVAGCGGGTYCPSAPVSREQMPVFVLRTLDPTLDPPACTTPMFSDVPADSPFCRWIEELARRQVVGGCGGGRYCPFDPVTREQMAVFIAAGFGLQLYGP